MIWPSGLGLVAIHLSARPQALGRGSSISRRVRDGSARAPRGSLERQVTVERTARRLPPVNASRSTARSGRRRVGGLLQAREPAVRLGSCLQVDDRKGGAPGAGASGRVGGDDLERVAARCEFVLARQAALKGDPVGAGVGSEGERAGGDGAFAMMVAVVVIAPGNTLAFDVSAADSMCEGELYRRGGVERECEPCPDGWFGSACGGSERRELVALAEGLMRRVDHAESRARRLDWRCDGLESGGPMLGVWSRSLRSCADGLVASRRGPVRELEDRLAGGSRD